jgi:copper chaperone CopZ
VPKIILEVPSMYGDHHVTAVRRLLLALPGIKIVYASSSFRVIEAQYDAAILTPQQIEAALDEAGYIGELGLPVETGVAATEKGGRDFFRHTAAFEQTGDSVGFTQNVSYDGRPLWPCPGMGAIAKIEEEETHG